MVQWINQLKASLDKPSRKAKVLRVLELAFGLGALVFLLVLLWIFLF